MAEDAVASGNSVNYHAVHGMVDKAIEKHEKKDTHTHDRIEGKLDKLSMKVYFSIGAASVIQIVVLLAILPQLVKTQGG